MSKIFISYRRDDSAGYAHAIHSQLVQHFSKDQVFMDVDTVEPGVDFVRAIEKAVGECDVLVALIGKRWVGGEPGGTSRLDKPKDYVRLEVSTALARDIRVIPVLVDGMTMPNEDSLPSPVQPITRRNAIEISNTRFNYDVDQLITAVRKILDATEAKRKADEEKERNGPQQEAEQRRLEAEAQRKSEEKGLHQQELERFEEDTRRKAEVGDPWRTYGLLAAVMGVVLIIFSFVWWLTRQETERVAKLPPLKETLPAPETKANGQKETTKQPPMAKLQPQKQTTEPSQEKLKERKGVPSQAPVEQKQEKPIETRPGKVFRDRLKAGERDLRWSWFRQVRFVWVTFKAAATQTRFRFAQYESRSLSPLADMK